MKNATCYVCNNGMIALNVDRLFGINYYLERRKMKDNPINWSC